jgi:hypothetical protein
VERVGEWMRGLPEQGLPPGTRVEFVDRFPGTLWYFQGVADGGQAYLFHDALWCEAGDGQSVDARGSCRPVPLGGFQTGDVLLLSPCARGTLFPIWQKYLQP